MLGLLFPVGFLQALAQPVYCKIDMGADVGRHIELIENFESGFKMNHGFGRLRFIRFGL